MQDVIYGVDRFRRLLSRLSQSIRRLGTGSIASKDSIAAAEQAGLRDSYIKLLELAEDNALLDFLVKRKAPCAIVADEQLLEILKAHQTRHPHAALYSVSDIDNERVSNPVAGPYYILTEGDEHAVKSRLRVLLTDMGMGPDILGTFNDLLPFIRSRRRIPLDGGLESAWASYHKNPRYMILCAPRSGSEYLVRSLESSGIGAPREHITAHFHKLFRSTNGSRPGGFDFIYWFVTLIHQSSVNGIFGTKIISHSYQNLEAALRSEEKQFLKSILAGSHLLYLYRSNKLLQALSFDRALSTEFWHSYEPRQMTAYRNGAEKWEYDFPRIANAVLNLSSEERYTHDLWKRHAGERGISACYEALNVDSLKERLRAALKVPPVPRGAALSTTILRDEKTKDYAERFMREYKARYVASNQETHLPLRVALEGGALRIDASPDAADQVAEVLGG